MAGATTERWSYGALEDAVLRLAEGFAGPGVEPGERLFIRMGNSLDFALLFFAANAMGAVPIPASPMLTRAGGGQASAASAARASWPGTGCWRCPTSRASRLFTPADIARLKRCARRRLCRYGGG